MNASVTDIGQYAKIPLHVARADVSETAKAVWRELALISRPHNPTVWLRQETISKILKVSTRTIRRAITDLENSSLIVPDGIHEGRYKKYKLIWQNIANNLGQGCPGSLDTEVLPPRTQLAAVGTDVQPHRTLVSDDLGHGCPPFILENQIRKPNYFLEKGADEKFENPKKELEALLVMYGKNWKQKFACLDGLSGRPTVEECVEQALNHSARHRCEDLKIYVDGWLRNASKSWIHQYHRELIAPASDPTLSKEAVALKLAEDKARRKRYEQRRREHEASASRWIPPTVRSTPLRSAIGV